MFEKNKIFLCMEYGKNGGAAEFFNLSAKDYDEALLKLSECSTYYNMLFISSLQV